MSNIQKDEPLAPLVLAPAQGQPKQLFVLLHDDAATPQQLMLLAQAVAQAFPLALLVLPYGPLSSSPSLHHWFDQAGLNEENYVGRVKQTLPALIHFIKQVQNKYELSGEYTALAGFGQGATVVLEASLAQPDLAGRVLAFSGVYAQLPATAPVATTLHFMHGANDPLIPVAVMREIHAHLSAMQGDATLDIASEVGHELHSSLIKQAIQRLQTYVPLRSWKTALTELKADPEFSGLNDPGSLETRTLH